MGVRRAQMGTSTPSTAAAAPAERARRLARLAEIIRERSYLTGREFKLASGAVSNVYFDMKMTLLDPEGINLAADLILDIIDLDSLDAVGGKALGACPIVDALCLKSQARKPVKGFYVRKEPKTRGTRKWIEGPLADGSRVILVEDITTTGGSVLDAVEHVGEHGCQVSRVVSIVDRLEGAETNLRAHGIELLSLFTMDDFVD